jgi:hypothetical protein
MRGLPLLVFTSAFQMLQQAKWFQPVLASSRVVLETNSTHVLLAAARAGAGVAVLPHLVARGAFIEEKTVRAGNGAAEADARALLLTHDHVSLLRAIEKCTKQAMTPPPQLGLVCFSDQEMRARTTVGVGHTDWDYGDRIGELRAHLMAAGLDVPFAGERWAEPKAQAAPSSVQGIIGAALLVLGTGWGAFLGWMLIDQIQFVAKYPDSSYQLTENLAAKGMLAVLAVLPMVFGLWMLVSAWRARRAARA